MEYFETNSFQIPNVLVDKLLRELAPREVVCLLVIIRQTRGWHRERDRISVTQFKRLTGITRDKSIYAVLEGLREAGFIRVHKRRGQINEYELTNTYKTKPGAESATTRTPKKPGAESATTPVAETAIPIDETRGGNRHTTKDIKTKDRNSRGKEHKENGHSAEVKLKGKENGHSAEVKGTQGLVSIGDFASIQMAGREIKRLNKDKRQMPQDRGAPYYGVERKRDESQAEFDHRVRLAASQKRFDDQVGVFENGHPVDGEAALALLDTMTGFAKEGAG